MKVRSIALLSLYALFILPLSHQGESWRVAKGKLVVALGGDPSILDPHMHGEVYAASILNNVYDFLVKRTFKDGKIEHEPMLATFWEAVNGTTWIFRLRRGVKFYNGEDLTARL